MRNSYSIDIEATPKQVFCWLDDPDRVMQWVSSLVENESLEETEDGVGSTFRQVVDENGRKIEMYGTVTAYEPDRQLAIHLETKSFDLDVDYRLEESEGRTRITQIADAHFKGIMRILGWLMMPFMKKAGAKQLASDFATLKSLCEASSRLESGEVPAS